MGFGKEVGLGKGKFGGGDRKGLYEGGRKGFWEQEGKMGCHALWPLPFCVAGVRAGKLGTGGGNMAGLATLSTPFCEMGRKGLESPFLGTTTGDFSAGKEGAGRGVREES